MPPPIPKARLHHIGYVVNDITEAARDFQKTFGYKIESDVIADPRQTAQVQFLRLPGDTCWLELVAPLGQPSKLDGALRRGVTLHHLCFETENIERSCGWLKNHDYTSLSAPVPATAFPGRHIAWFASRSLFLVELVEAGGSPLSLRRPEPAYPREADVERRAEAVLSFFA